MTKLKPGRYVCSKSSAHPGIVMLMPSVSLSHCGAAMKFDRPLNREEEMELAAETRRADREEAKLGT